MRSGPEPNSIAGHPSTPGSFKTGSEFYSSGPSLHLIQFWGRALISKVSVLGLLAIELLAACQGIEFLRPLRTTTPLEKVYDLVRSVVRPWLKDRFMAPDIEAAHRLLVEQKVWEVAVPYIEKYRREHIPESRPVSPTAFSLDSLRMNKCVGTDHSDQD
uniref:Uncharacterized protein n=1 Tax=Chrysemys picta bellii TaxID=8478 RepID=A0A8C3F588_CHRPI